MLAPAVLDMAEKRGQRSVDRERNAGIASEYSEATGVGPIHPESIAEVDLTCVIAACEKELDRLLGSLV
jgi:hypothetical protein